MKRKNDIRRKSPSLIVLKRKNKIGRQDFFLSPLSSGNIHMQKLSKIIKDRLILYP